MLGPLPVQLLAFESFGKDWVTDVVKQLKLKAEVLDAPYGELPDLTKVQPDADLVFTWNGTTSGVRVPNGDFIAADREGLTICDATSACFAQDARLGQARCGDLLLAEGAGRRGRARHADPLAARRRAAGELHAALAAAEDLPHDQGRQGQPRDLRGRDHQHALDALRGGLSRRAEVGRARSAALPSCSRRADENLQVLEDWVAKTPWVDFLAEDPATRSNTVGLPEGRRRPRSPPCPTTAQADFAKKLAALLEKEGVALDIGGYRDAPPGLRIWCGATVEADDLDALTPWLDWAFATVAAELSPA